jgi:hypothetical protein
VRRRSGYWECWRYEPSTPINQVTPLIRFARAEAKFAVRRQRSSRDVSRSVGRGGGMLWAN